MQEQTAEEYVAVFREIISVVNQSVLQVAAALGVNAEEDREAFQQGMKLAPQYELRAESGEAAPLNTGWGEPDYKRLKELLLTAPEPSRADREALRKAGRSVPHLLRRAFLELAKALPHPPGGHPFGLTPEERLDACKRINTYRIIKHMDTAQAIKEVAHELNKKKHAVDRKTLRRYYQKYLQEQEQDHQPEGRARRNIDDDVR